MCTWITEKTAVTAYGKGVPVDRADHGQRLLRPPRQRPLDHALIIDFLNEAAGPGARVAVELSAESARALVRAIEPLVAGEECHSRPARVERANASGQKGWTA